MVAPEGPRPACAATVPCRRKRCAGPPTPDGQAGSPSLALDGALAYTDEESRTTPEVLMSRPHTWVLVAASLLPLAVQAVPREVAGLGQQLGSEQFSEREAATKRLEEIGEAALGPLRAAAAQRDDPEVRLRAQGLLVAIERRLVALDRRRDYERLRG